MEDTQTQKKVKIRIENLYKNYGKAEVLRGLNLDIYEGETVVILGRSGVGKSVLLKQIIGIENPDKGFIEIDGKRSKNLRIGTKDSMIKMGMLFQGAALFDSMTVGENTAFYLRQHESHLSEKEISDRVAEALDMVGLEGIQNKMPSDLSGGMRKRAALARVIIYRPSIILYDEPTTGLDPITSMQINDLINKTKHELHSTSVVVTHDIRSAIEISDRIALHHEGKIAFIAPKDQFFHLDDPTIKTFFDNATIPLNIR